MCKTLQLKRGSASDNNSFTGLPGELTVDLDTPSLRLHDGLTSGGLTIQTSPRTVYGYYYFPTDMFYWDPGCTFPITEDYQGNVGSDPQEGNKFFDIRYGVGNAKEFIYCLAGGGRYSSRRFLRKRSNLGVRPNFKAVDYTQSVSSNSQSLVCNFRGSLFHGNRANTGMGFHTFIGSPEVIRFSGHSIIWPASRDWIAGTYVGRRSSDGSDVYLLGWTNRGLARIVVDNPDSGTPALNPESAELPLPVGWVNDIRKLNTSYYCWDNSGTPTTVLVGNGNQIVACTYDVDLNPVWGTVNTTPIAIDTYATACGVSGLPFDDDIVEHFQTQYGGSQGVVSYISRSTGELLNSIAFPNVGTGLNSSAAFWDLQLDVIIHQQNASANNFGGFSVNTDDLGDSPSWVAYRFWLTDTANTTNGEFANCAFDGLGNFWSGRNAAVLQYGSLD